MSEISGRVTELHSIDNDACGISFWTDKIRIITGEKALEITTPIKTSSIVTLSLEINDVMKDCLKRRRELKDNIKKYNGNPEFQWLQNQRIELLKQLKNEYNARRADDETELMRGCGNGEGAQDTENCLF